jgi:hypothetical protein
LTLETLFTCAGFGRLATYHPQVFWSRLTHEHPIPIRGLAGEPAGGGGQMSRAIDARPGFPGDRFERLGE